MLLRMVLINPTLSSSPITLLQSSDDGEGGISLWSLMLKPITSQLELGGFDGTWTPNAALVCLSGWCPDTNERDDTLSPLLLWSRQAKTSQIWLPSRSGDVISSVWRHGRALRTPFGLRWERRPAVHNEYDRPSDSIRWLIKIKLVRVSNTWTLIISVSNGDEERQQSSHHNPVVHSFRSNERWHLWQAYNISAARLHSFAATLLPSAGSPAG